MGISADQCHITIEPGRSRRGRWCVWPSPSAPVHRRAEVTFLEAFPNTAAVSPPLPRCIPWPPVLCHLRQRAAPREAPKFGADHQDSRDRVRRDKSQHSGFVPHYIDTVEGSRDEQRVAVAPTSARGISSERFFMPTKTEYVEGTPDWVDARAVVCGHTPMAAPLRNRRASPSR